MKTRKIIYLLGTDGSGKTTNALQLVREGLPGQRIEYIYSQYRPLLILPMKVAAKLFFKKKESLFGDYESYAQKKKKYVGKLKLLTRIYCLVWYLDHVLQIFVKMLIVRMKNPTVIVIDRYYLDSVVNLSCLQNLNNNQMVSDAKMIEKVLPKADLCLYLDVSEDVAYSRKDDIPAKDYLSERREKYLALAPLYNFHVIDADKSQQSVYVELKEKIVELLCEINNIGNV